MVLWLLWTNTPDVGEACKGGGTVGRATQMSLVLPLLEFLTMEDFWVDTSDSLIYDVYSVGF